MAVLSPAVVKAPVVKMRPVSRVRQASTPPIPALAAVAVAPAQRGAAPVAPA
jgi:hypothetical protein